MDINTSNHSRQSLTRSNSNSSFVSAHSQATSKFSVGSVSSSEDLVYEDSAYRQAKTAHASAEAQKEIKKLTKDTVKDLTIMACDTLAVGTQIGVAALRVGLKKLEKTVTSATKTIKEQMKKS